MMLESTSNYITPIKNKPSIMINESSTVITDFQTDCTSEWNSVDSPTLSEIQEN